MGADTSGSPVALVEGPCGGPVRLVLSGSVDVRVAAQLKAMILEAVAEQGEVEADTSQATEVDYAVLQLLVAAVRDSLVTLARPLGTAVVAAAATAGLVRFLEADDT